MRIDRGGPALVLGAALLVAPSHGWCGCPEYAFGITLQSRGADHLFYVTAKAEALADGRGSEDLAAAEARIAAKALLANDRRVPKSDANRIRAVSEVSRCTVGNVVFVTLMMDEANARRAITLENAIQSSFRSSPTPQPAER